MREFLRHKSSWGVTLFVLTLFGLALPPIRYAIANIYTYNLKVASMTDSDIEKLALLDEPAHQVVRWVRKNLSPQDSVLAFRQSEIGFYGVGKMRRIYSDIDPAALPIFSATSKEKISIGLQSLGITYITTPYYSIPTIYNSEMSEFLADPNYVEIAFDRGARVFRVLPPPDRGQSVSVDWTNRWAFSGDSLENEDWTYWDSKAGFGRIGQTYNQDRLLFHTPVDTSLFKESIPRSSYLISGRGLPEVSPNNSFSPPLLEGGKIYRFELKYRGSGEVNAFLLQYSDIGELLGSKFLWGAVIGSKNVLTTPVMFMLDSHASNARLLFQVRENASFLPLSARLGVIANPHDIAEIDHRRSRKWRVKTANLEKDLSSVSDWGDVEEGVFLSQTNGLAITLESPRIDLAGSDGLCVYLKGSGFMSLQARLASRCASPTCRELSADFGNFLMRDKPTKVVLAMNAATWQGLGEIVPGNPFLERSEKYSRLQFQLRRHEEYKDTKHEFGHIEVLSMHLLSKNGKCEEENILFSDVPAIAGN